MKLFCTPTWFQALVVTCLVAVAQAETITHVVSVSSRPVPWDRAVLLPAFNPSRGTLHSVEVGLRGRAQGVARYENLMSEPCLAEIHFGTLAALTLPNGQDILYAAASASFLDVLPEFDGVLDYAGKSGREHPDLRTTLNNRRTLTSTPSMDWFQSTPAHPKRAVRLGLRLDPQCEASSGTAYEWEQSCAIAVTVTYHYTPVQ